MATAAISSTTSTALASTPAAVAATNKANAQKIITSMGAGSGVDVTSLAQNLVAAEQGPKASAINAKITKNESRISGYSALSFVLSNVKTALTDLKDQNSFNALSASNTNSNAFTVTTSATGAAGSHDVEVLQLAKAQRTVSQGVASPTASMNGGKALSFDFVVGGVSSSIDLPDNKDTPQDLVSAINSAGKGVKAQLVNSGDGSPNPYQIVLTGEVGSAAAFTLSPKFSGGGVQSASAHINANSPMSLKLTVGTANPVSLTLATGADTPGDIVNAINTANTGVTAALVANPTGSTFPFKIVVTGPTGAPSDFSITADYGQGAGDEPFVVPNIKFDSLNPVNQTAMDAQVKVDGITFKRNTNVLEDVVPGLTLTLKNTTTSPATIDLTRDNSGVKTKMAALVQAYNDATSIFKEVADPKSTLATYGATLVGDSTVRSVKQQLREMIMGPSSTPGTGVSALWQMGVSIDQTGTMTVDNNKLDTVLKDNYADVVKTFTGNQNGLSVFSPAPAGIAGDAVKKISNLVGKTGALVTQTTSATTQNDKYKEDLTKLQTRMDSLLLRYQKQFSSMDSLVGNVNQQKTSLKSTFDGMMATLTGKSG